MKQTKTGLQVFDENGKVIVDVNENMTKFIGIADTGTEDGALSDVLPNGYLCIIPIKYWLPEDFYQSWPQFWQTGHSFEWKFYTSYSDARVRMLFMYGVY